MAEFSIFANTDAASLTSFGWGEFGQEVEVLTVGTELRTATDAWITHFRYPHVLTNGKPSRKTMALYDITESMVAGPVLMPPGVPGQWNTAPLPEPFRLVPGTRYWVATFYPDGGYPAQSGYFTPEFYGPAQEFGPLIVPSGAGTYGYDNTIRFPNGSFNSASYFSDVVVSDVDPTVIVDPPAAHNIFGADGAAYTAHALINGTLVPVTLTP